MIPKIAICFLIFLPVPLRSLEVQFHNQDKRIPIVVFESGASVRFAVPRNCYVKKSITAIAKAFLVIYKERPSGGSDFNMLVSVGSSADGKAASSDVEILVTESDFRSAQSMRWIEDVRDQGSGIEVLLANYSKLKLPADVKRAWLKLEDLFGNP